MSEREFPRVKELQNSIPDPDSPSCYFRGFDETVKDPIKRKHFIDIEKELQGLSPKAWHFLKSELEPLLTARDEKRGWRALFDKLNHAKAYNYLATMGCTGITFIRESLTRTPDLQANLGSRTVLCEVKTIHPSDSEIEARNNFHARAILMRLTDGFFRKLHSDLQNAKAQMEAYCADPTVRRIVYIVVNFDDILHEYVAEYSEQIDAFMGTNPVPGLEAKFDIKPPFYAATA